MKCNLIIETNEIAVREYNLIEDEGLVSLAGSRPGISFTYEDDEEDPGKHVFIIKGESQDILLRFLSFIELPVRVIY